MRCDAVREIIESEGLNRPPAVEAHLTSCAACKVYLRDWERVRAGLVALRAEEPPEPSIGFTARVMRGLESASAEFQWGPQFLDQIGRRFVYATLMMAVMLLLLLVLPSSGPFRSPGISESVLVQAQAATLSNDQMLGVDGMDSGDTADSAVAPTTNNGSGGQGAR